MIKTITTSQLIIEGFICQWQKFKQKLPEDIQPEFDNLINKARKHTHPDPEGIPFQQIIMSILIEQEKEINWLRNKLTPYLRMKCPRCNSERNSEDFDGRLCPDCKEYLLFFLPKPNKLD